jgi:hypothetical protein
MEANGMALIEHARELQNATTAKAGVLEISERVPALRRLSLIRLCARNVEA